MNNLIFEDLNKDYGFYYKFGKSLLKDKSQFQKIDVLETDIFGKVLRLDELTQVGVKGEVFYHEPMVHLPMLTHQRPKSVLVIGGGDGGINREVLRYKSVEQLTQVDLDAKVVEVCQKYLPEISNGCWDDPRTKLIIKDAREHLADNKEQFDVIIMDMTDPFGPSAALYTKEFFTLVKNSLRDKHGLFCMHSESPIARPKAFASIYKTLNMVFNHISSWYVYIQMYGAYWSLAVCSDKASMRNKKAKLIDKKIKKYDLQDLSIVSGDTYVSYQTEMPIIKKIKQSKWGKVITDADIHFPDELELACFHERN